MDMVIYGPWVLMLALRFCSELPCLTTFGYFRVNAGGTWWSCTRPFPGLRGTGKETAPQTLGQDVNSAEAADETYETQAWNILELGFNMFETSTRKTSGDQTTALQEAPTDNRMRNYARCSCR